MPLPGKLCIGILEEDNPQKSYFRYKPLLIEEGGLYIPYAETDAYPEDGCIRIVPDKNESSHFKARMRRIGLFAVVDLRDHPNENDKIRVNKNYHGDDTERNAHIIYSDVVREPAADMIFSLLSMDAASAEIAALAVPPATARVLLRPEGDVLAETWLVSADEAQPETFRLTRDDKSMDVAEMQIFDIPGFRDEILSFAILPPDKVEHVAELPAPKPAKVAVPVPEARKEVTVVRPAEVKPAIVEPAVPVAPTEPEKPWITHDQSFAPPTVDPSLPPHQRTLAVQTGINPRRGRSLQEIVDEKWRHSRIDQLGHPIPPLATSNPAQSPVEAALSAVEQVWSNGELRAELVSAFVKMEGLDDALDARRAAVRESAVNEQLTELEAQRLKMLADMEQLKRKGADVREMLKKEIRADEASAFADAVAKTEAARIEQARHEAECAKARAAAESAEDALNALVDGRFEQRLHEFAINSHAVALLKKLESGEVVPPAVVGTDVDAEELIGRVVECFADSGMPIGRAEAINLLICAAQSPILLITGAPGTGKSTTARLLARALGVEAAEFAPERKPLTDEIDKLPDGNAPRMVLLDDANLAPAADLTRGLTPAAECGRVMVVATLQDDGCPVPAHLFGRAITLRMTEPSAAEAWAPAVAGSPKNYAPVTVESLKKAFAPKGEVSAEQAKRVEKLRADLALLDVKLSRKSLNALWNFCAAAAVLMPLEPSAVLDLAISQCVLPGLLAGAPLKALSALPKMMEDLPRCKALLKQPLPIQI